MLPPQTPIFASASRLRRVGRLELGLATRFLRQPAESVPHVHHNLGIVLNMQLAQQFLDIHGNGSQLSAISFRRDAEAGGNH